MKTPWQVRMATPDDAAARKTCMESAYQAYRPEMGGSRLPPMDADYAAEIRDFPVWVAERNGTVAGGLIMAFDDERAAIANIAVHPDSQGQGIGGGLMKLADAQARQRGYRELHLATHVLLTENLSLYRHPGWTETGRDAVRVHMSKTL